MVRKWSYLDTKHTDLTFEDSVLKHLKRYKFKVFRTTTRFKKWNLGLFKVIPNRKLYIKRKHKTNNLYWLPVAMWWSRYYFSTRQITRFYQLINILPISISSVDSELVSFKSRSNQNSFGISTSSCSRKLLSFALNSHRVKSNTNLFEPITLGSKATLSYAFNITDFESLNDVGLNLFCYENSYYQLTEVSYNININALLLKHSINYSQILRKLIINLTLININR